MTGEDGSGADPTEETAVDQPTYLWTRPDTERDAHTGNEGVLPIDDIHLHRYCAVVPFDDWRESGSGEVRFLDGLMRTGLRNTPTAIFLVVAVLLVGAELSPTVQGVSVFLPDLPLIVVPVAALFGIVWAVMMLLVADTGLVDGTETAKALVVYGLLAILAVGTVGSVYLVVTAADPTALPPNVIYVSGYLLMLYLCGMLVYDGMVKTEYLFEHLHEKLLVEEEEAYKSFRKTLSENLSATPTVPVVGVTLPVPTYALFAPLFVSQFAAVWLLQSGPQGLGWWLNFLVNVTLNLFIVAVAFQFLVLIKSFHDLVSGRAEVTDDGTTVRRDLISYRPFHPDGHGGFRDFGKFATRVNLILIVGGLYAIFRLYVQGARSPVFEPSGGVLGALGVGGEMAPLVWLVSYVGPVLAYAVAAAAWLYYSFWQLHVKMAREREQQYTEWAYQQRVDEEGERDPEAALGDLDDAVDWLERRQNAPVWPIRSQQLFSIITGTFVPLLFSIREFLL